MRIADLSTTIPFGWQLAMPDAHLQAGTYWALRDEVWRYQDARQQERWNDATLQDCLCKNLPPRADNCNDGLDYHFPDLDALPAFRAKEDHIFGPILWKVLHNKRIGEEENPGQWLRRWHGTIPCPTCSVHFSQVLNELPPDFTSEPAFLDWSTKAHNAVSKNIGKPQWTLEQAREYYGREDKEGELSAESAANSQEHAPQEP